MAWEQPAESRRYYTTSTRVDGKVTRQYLGKGKAAKAAARRQEKRGAERREYVEWLKTQQAVDTAMDAYEDILLRVFEQMMLQSGCYCHRGEWRKRRQTSERETQQ